jgi:hypothetical protein
MAGATPLLVTSAASVNIPLDLMWERIGCAASAVVLEALAVEIALKARLKQAGQNVPDEHDHSKLFPLLPQKERADIQSRYEGRRSKGLMADTVDEVFKVSGKTFVSWRYMYEQSDGVTARVGEMRCVFEALAETL